LFDLFVFRVNLTDGKLSFVSFGCKFCLQKHFATLKEIVEHKKLEHKDAKISCKLCKAEYPYNDETHKEHLLSNKHKMNKFVIEKMNLER
jgi:hypothetical protein